MMYYVIQSDKALFYAYSSMGAWFTFSAKTGSHRLAPSVPLPPQLKNPHPKLSTK